MSGWEERLPIRWSSFSLRVCDDVKEREKKRVSVCECVRDLRLRKSHHLNRAMELRNVLVFHDSCFCIENTIIDHEMT
jgi:hypothetical protein